MGRMLLEVWKEPALGRGAGWGLQLRDPHTCCPTKPGAQTPSPRPSLSLLSTAVPRIVGWGEIVVGWGEPRFHLRAQSLGEKSRAGHTQGKKGVWDFAKLLGRGSRRRFFHTRVDSKKKKKKNWVQN